MGRSLCTIFLLAALAAAPGTANAGEADVVDVRVTQTEDATYCFAVDLPR